MYICVFSRNEMIEFNQKKASVPYIIISINNVGDEHPNFICNKEKSNCLAACYLYFDDVEKGEPNCIDDAQLDELIDFIGEMPTGIEHICVHCGAGKSRSAGMAAALMKFFDGSDWIIFKNPFFIPNMTVYRSVLTRLLSGKIDEEEIEEKERKNIQAWRELNKEDLD